jgi:hypothetical protein
MEGRRAGWWGEGGKEGGRETALCSPPIHDPSLFRPTQHTPTNTHIQLILLLFPITPLSLSLPPPPPLQPPLPPSSGASADLSLRDLVQRFAEEHSITFLPKFGRFHDGLQVYMFGRISCVLDNTSSMIRAQLRDRWAPVSLETLLQQAQLLG